VLTLAEVPIGIIAVAQLFSSHAFHLAVELAPSKYRSATSLPPAHENGLGRDFPRRASISCKSLYTTRVRWRHGGEPPVCDQRVTRGAGFRGDPDQICSIGAFLPVGLQLAFGGVADQPVEPSELVGELRTGLRIAIGKVDTPINPARQR
jgi:hypothetical protein